MAQARWHRHLSRHPDFDPHAARLVRRWCARAAEDDDRQTKARGRLVAVLPQRSPKERPHVVRALPRPEPGDSPVAKKFGRRDSEGWKGGIMSLLALLIVCAVIISIGIASNLVAR